MKVHCTRHEDVNPSCEIYEESGYCFVCNSIIPLEELNVKTPTKREKENIEETITYISGLPMQPLRALSFHADSEGYYILWPDKSYYKYRTFNGSTRYLGPSGHKPPIFIYPGRKEHLILVEGEINCMSLKQAYYTNEISIGSFGGINNCYNYIDTYSLYSTIHVIVDRDSPGVVNGLNLKEILINKGKRVQLVALPKDFNDVLVESGVSGIQQICKEEGVVL